MFLVVVVVGCKLCREFPGTTTINIFSTCYYTEFSRSNVQASFECRSVLRSPDPNGKDSVTVFVRECSILFQIDTSIWVWYTDMDMFNMVYIRRTHMAKLSPHKG